MPSETPPLRVKKPWRMPGRSASRVEVSTGRAAMVLRWLSKAGGVQPGEKRQSLEELAHLVGGDQAVS